MPWLKSSGWRSYWTITYLIKFWTPYYACIEWQCAALEYCYGYRQVSLIVFVLRHWNWHLGSKLGGRCIYVITGYLNVYISFAYFLAYGFLILNPGFFTILLSSKMCYLAQMKKKVLSSEKYSLKHIWILSFMLVTPSKELQHIDFWLIRADIYQ